MNVYWIKRQENPYQTGATASCSKQFFHASANIHTTASYLRHFWMADCFNFPSVTFCMSRRRRELYSGHGHLCVCLSVHSHSHSTAQTRM